MADAAHAKNHSYHLVDPSPWPFVASVSAFALALGGIAYMHGSSLLWTIPGFLGVFYTMFVWWRDVIHEGQKGDHTPIVALGLRYGMILFIASEAMLFDAYNPWARSVELNSTHPLTGMRVMHLGAIAKEKRQPFADYDIEAAAVRRGVSRGQLWGQFRREAMIMLAPVASAVSIR